MTSRGIASMAAGGSVETIYYISNNQSASQQSDLCHHTNHEHVFSCSRPRAQSEVNSYQRESGNCSWRLLERHAVRHSRAIDNNGIDGACQRAVYCIAAVSHVSMKAAAWELRGRHMTRGNIATGNSRYRPSYHGFPEQETPPMKGNPAAAITPSIISISSGESPR